MQGTSIMKNSVKIVLCILLLLMLVQGVQAAETYQFVTKWGTQGTGDGQFSYPSGVAVDNSGNIYVADRVNNRIQKFNSDGTFLAKWGSSGSGDGQFHIPEGVAVDSSGNVYVADEGNNRIQKFSSDGTFLAKWGLSGSGDGQFNYPHVVAVDSSGNVYVADYGYPPISPNDTFQHKIQKFSSTGTFLAKLGTMGFGDGRLSNPTGVAVDNSGNVYVADCRYPLQDPNDTFQQQIQKFGSDGTFLGKLGSMGSGDGQFYYSHGIAVDSSGNVYVTDTGNNQIQKFSSTGIFLAKWGSEGTGDGQFKAPWGITVDSSGNIYVTDRVNCCIQKFAPVRSSLIVSSITPTTATNAGAVNVTDISGAGFVSGAGVKITKTGGLNITATRVTVVSPTNITCSFDLTGKGTGPWNVVVTNPDGTSATLTNGFTIITYAPTPLSVTAISPATGTNDRSISATVTGTGFKPGAVVRLTLVGQPDIVASSVTLTGNTLITCTFDLNGKTTGTWDLAVTNPGDGTTSVRSTAFTLTTRHIPNTNGTIIVSSTPKDALVFLDGSLKGTGSVTLEDVSPGYHSVRVTKILYNDYRIDVQVAAGSISYVNAGLTPVSGTIFAWSNPPDATVYVDGIVQGISPTTIHEVSPGSHTVSFSKSGYKDESRTTSVSAGQTSEISVELKENGWDWLNPILLIIIGVIVLILAIIVALLRKKKNRWDNY